MAPGNKSHHNFGSPDLATTQAQQVKLKMQELRSIRYAQLEGPFLFAVIAYLLTGVQIFIVICHFTHHPF